MQHDITIFFKCESDVTRKWNCCSKKDPNKFLSIGKVYTVSGQKRKERGGQKEVKQFLLIS